MTHPSIATSTTAPIHPYNMERLERLVRRRAGMRLGWLIHATVYVLVNAGLATLSLLAGKHWALFPALGWGLGLAVHGAVVWMGLHGQPLMQRLMDQERQRLSTQRDPW